MGTPDFAVSCLERLVEKSKNVVGVVTQEDKPKGRGKKILYTPVKEYALSKGIPVFQPNTLKDNSFENELKELNPDIIIVVAYGKILPKYILDYPKYGCVNIHASLLPKYRGAGPIQWCLINGEKKTGITAMYMNEGLDTGDMLLKKETEIGEYENCEELFLRLAVLGADVLIETIDLISKGELKPEKQDDNEATYAPMVSKETGRIDWNKPGDEIINLIRGTYVWPVAHTLYNGEILKIFSAVKGKEHSLKVPGSICSAGKGGLEVMCGDGKTIIIKEAQFFNSKKMSIESYLNGHTIDCSTILGI